MFGYQYLLLTSIIVPTLLFAMGPASRLFSVVLTFISVVNSGHIDTHFHALPPAYIDALTTAGGDPSGYPTPAWTLEAAVKSMNLIDTSLGIVTTQYWMVKVEAN